MIAVAREAATPTIAEVKRAARDRLVDDARADPLVAAVLARFPGAEIVDVRVTRRGAASMPPAGDAPIVSDDQPFDEDD